MNKRTNEEVNVEEIGVENIRKTVIRMTVMSMVKTMVMRPVVNGESRCSGRFGEEAFCKEKEIVGTWFR